ncbi:glycosyltransferase family 2 protein [Cognatishimia sp. F0-27]|nr:glycosyltransferase family 2 protein [Cognatishimia sp. F0-27]
MKGGLDVNLIARLWTEAGDDPVIRPLARHLLERLIDDPGTVFQRLKAIRRAKRARRPEKQPDPAPRPARAAQAPRWGIAATVHGPADRILDFAAWHLDQGAHALWIYLDSPCPEAQHALSKIRAIRVRHTSEAWWAARGGRPDRHQIRQVRNLRHAYRVAGAHVDWLAHIDADELLLPQDSVQSALAALPPDCLTARMRPIEALGPGDALQPGETLFKALPRDPATRHQVTERVFPGWADHLAGGFIGHIAGKLFVRTGLQGMQIRIHNAYRDGVANPGERILETVDLGHFHAPDLDSFLAAYRFRASHGSYRAELSSTAKRPGALSLHDLFAGIESREGHAGLCRFYDAVCAAHTPLCARLEAEGLLRRRRLGLKTLRNRYFGAPISAEPPHSRHSPLPRAQDVRIDAGNRICKRAAIDLSARFP